jgi:hypothetical protein
LCRRRNSTRRAYDRIRHVIEIRRTRRGEITCTRGGTTRRITFAEWLLARWPPAEHHVASKQTVELPPLAFGFGRIRLA